MWKKCGIVFILSIYTIKEAQNIFFEIPCDTNVFNSGLNCYFFLLFPLFVVLLYNIICNILLFITCEALCVTFLYEIKNTDLLYL